MDQGTIAIIAAVSAVIVAIVTGLFAFWGIRVQSARQLEASQITLAHQDAQKEHELEIEEHKVTIESVRFVTESALEISKHHDQLWRECEERCRKNEEQHATQMAALARKHRDEIEPLRRYAQALQKGDIESENLRTLHLEMAKRVEAQTAELVAARERFEQSRALLEAQLEEALAELRRYREAQ